ncbi:MAG: family 5 extracellular solute-binding protein [Anaerolineaceae bacterium]|nr:MAG: family 5 extracellular solute-binding protein [Anaerolineaceae bacterium]
MKTPFRIIALMTLAVSVALAGCGGTDDAGGVATQPPAATPTVDLAPTPIGPETVSRSIRLDPAIVTDADSLTVSAYLYDGLTRLDTSGQPQPALAVNWTVSDDGLDYVVELRQGVTFHDGAAFNADVVLANFNRWFDPADPLHGAGAYAGWTETFLGFLGDVDAGGIPKSPFDGIEKQDAYTVILHLNRPYEALMANLAQPYFFILDPAALAASGDAYGASAGTVNGTGAFVISSWTDAGLALSPNAAYWGGAPASGVQFGWK